jgi:pyruvate,orthophosphate dikinase
MPRAKTLITAPRAKKRTVKLVRLKGKTLPLLVPFGGKARAVKSDRSTHGGKGASLIAMTAMGLSVPPGFILTTEAYRLFKEEGTQAFFLSIQGDFRRGIARLETVTGRRFGDACDPLLLSIRSGAPASMPGMMDTLLNVGLTPANVFAVAERQGALFAWGSLLRLISQFAKLVLLQRRPEESSPSHVTLPVRPKLQRSEGESLSKVGRAGRLEGLLNMGNPPKNAEEAKGRCTEALALLSDAGTPFPEDPWEQLEKAIETVFHSWDNDRAKTYRKLQGISESLGTACTVQAMVFGNRSEEGGTGVCFSRDPSTGAKGLIGEFLRNAQGEDVVAGLRTPEPLSKLPCHIFRELERNVILLERKFRDVVDVEFTVEDGVLWFLQCRSAKRSSEAALIIGESLQKEGMISEEELLQRITPDHVTSLLRPRFDAAALDAAKRQGRLLTKGLPAGPGAASGRIVFSDERLPPHDPRILVRRETSPEDVSAMSRSAGVLTIHGGMSSHAALVSRQLGIVTVVGCEEARLDDVHRQIWFGNKPLKEGDWISLNGSTGEVYEGRIATAATDIERTPLPRFLRRADAARRLGVFANADTPDQARLARKLGAEGIGLARTEHMFFGDRLPLIQQLILANTASERLAALEKLETLQRENFRGLLLAMDHLPVIVRTIDPPLHEFLPKEGEEIAALASRFKMKGTELERRIEGMREANPMIGFRGCRLGIVHPAIPLMQIRALVSAACDLALAGKDPKPEIMIPLTTTAAELKEHRCVLMAEAQRVMAELGCPFHLSIGTMIEVPRAALLAGEIAPFADFMSFGTNDLTQLTFGISRDDASTFLPTYLEKGMYPSDPFATIDRDGVGELMHMAVDRARREKPDLKIGICGEHGGDPASIAFCEELNLTYVSCSPYRVPVARLAAAQAVLRGYRGYRGYREYRGYR